MKTPTRHTIPTPRALNSEELDLITGGDAAVTSSADSTDAASTDAARGKIGPKQKAWLCSNSATGGTDTGSGS